MRPNVTHWCPRIKVHKVKPEACLWHYEENDRECWACAKFQWLKGHEEVLRKPEEYQERY